MNIINPYRYSIGGVVNNTFIGGGGTSVTSATDLAGLTSLSVGNISNFSIDAENNVSCYIDTTYTINQGAFLSDTDITSYVDYQGKVTAIGSGVTDGCFRYCYSLICTIFPSATTTGDSVFGGISTRLTRYEVISFPLVTPIGSNAGNQNSFLYAKVDYLYTKSDNQTNNAGLPDGDLTFGSDITNLNYSTNTTTPSSVSDLALGTAYGTWISTTWTAPSSTNAIDLYMIFVNKIYHSYTTSVNAEIYGLKANTSYDVNIITLDEMGNISEFSNTITTSTNATDNIPTADIVSYWNLNTNSNDQVGTNNGADTSITYVSNTRAVGNVADFTASTSSVIEVADSADLSFGNGTTDSAFSISLRVKYNSTTRSMIFDKSNNTVREYDIFYNTSANALIWKCYSGGTTGNDIRISYDWSANGQTTDVWYSIIGTYDGSGLDSGLALYIDGVSVGTASTTGTYVAMSNTTAPVNMGKFKSDTALSLNGYMDEVSIFDVELTASEAKEIFSKQKSLIGLTS